MTYNKPLTADQFAQWAKKIGYRHLPNQEDRMDVLKIMWLSYQLGVSVGNKTK